VRWVSKDATRIREQEHSGSDCGSTVAHSSSPAPCSLPGGSSRRDVPAGSTSPAERWQIALAIEELCQRNLLLLSLSLEDLHPHLNMKQQMSLTDPQALLCLRTANIGIL